ncbi:MAG: hypothetical protein NTX61_04100 [Bacteroidetes bacterium]|nr:hypothetical protein [Bacteroidota bacterium]
MKTKLSLILVIMVFCLGIKNLQARDEFSRTVKKEYTVNPDAKLILANRFGDVHINNWDKNMVSIEIKVTVEASSEQAAAKILDKISISSEGTPSLVEVKTLLDGDFHGKNRLHIDYTVSVPVGINLDLTDKFGDIFINELSGSGKITVGYGNLEINKLNNSDNLLNIEFSKADIKSIKGAVVNLKYSELKLDYAGSLMLDSKYSDIEADKVISLSGSYEGGKLTMENSTAFDSKSKFSDIDITRIEKSLNLNIQYGNCEVKEMPADFSNINIHNKYANVSIGISKEASYELNADLKFCDLDFPEDKANISLKSITTTTKEYHAKVGKVSNPPARVSIHSEYGNVSLE